MPTKTIPLTTFSFTLLIDGPDLQTDENMNALFEAGCDDALFGSRDGIQFADFDRDAQSFAEAIGSAIRDIKSAVPEAAILRVEPEEFVSQKAIADRTGLSKEYVRLLANGERSSGGFPAPVRWVDAKTRLWLWSDVAEWIEIHLGRKVERAHGVHTVAAFNGLLEVRRHAHSLSPEEGREELAELVREDEELRSLLGV